MKSLDEMAIPCVRALVEAVAGGRYMLAIIARNTIPRESAADRRLQKLIVQRPPVAMLAACYSISSDKIQIWMKARIAGQARFFSKW